MEVRRLIDLNNKEQINITGNNKIDTEIERFLLEYVDYIQNAVGQAKEGNEIDDKAIYALGDAVRVIHHMKKLIKEPPKFLE